MSNSIRFIGAAILAWAAVRAVSLGLVPGTQALAFDTGTAPAADPIPRIEPTRLQLPQPGTLPSAIDRGGTVAGPDETYPRHVDYPVYLPTSVGVSPPPSATQIVYVDRLPSQAAIGGDVAALAPFGSIKPRAVAIGSSQSGARQTTPDLAETPRGRGYDRLSVSSWATMRGRSGSESLGGAGSLGGSQAGARLLWRVGPRLSASVRASAPINSRRGAEGAAGVRYQPFADWPVAVTLERRQRVGAYGQSAFAAFAEGGVHGRSLPWNLALDAYLQGGVVDFNDPIWFVDGQAAVTRPVWRNLSAGVGVWGAGQPGLYRLDVGPRASLSIGTRMKVHLDYRYRLYGNAMPGSGGVVTLAGDF